MTGKAIRERKTSVFRRGEDWGNWESSRGALIIRLGLGDLVLDEGPGEGRLDGQLGSDIAHKLEILVRAIPVAFQQLLILVLQLITSPINNQFLSKTEEKEGVGENLGQVFSFFFFPSPKDLGMNPFLN